MMEGVKYLFVVVLFVGSVQCKQTFQEVVPNDLSNPDRCYDSTIDAFFSVGSVWWRPGQCNRLTCQRSGDPGFLNINGVRCEQYTDIPVNCKLTKTSPVSLFPACCPTLVCAEVPIDVETNQKPAIVAVEMADIVPMTEKVNEDTSAETFVKPAMIDDKDSTMMENEKPVQEVSEEAVGNMNGNVMPDETVEEPAVVLALNPAEEVIPATLTINVADENMPADDSIAQENMKEEVKLPATMESEVMSEEVKQPEAMSEEIKVAEVMAEETRIPEVMNEEAKVPDMMVEDVKIPEVMAEETRIPEVMDEKAKVPDMMVEDVKIPEVMAEESKTPEAMDEKTKETDMMAEETNIPEAMAEETKTPESMNEDTKIPEAMDKETKIPEFISEETKIPEAMDEETKIPEVMGEETKNPETMDEEAKIPEAMNEETKEPEVPGEEKPLVMEEKPVVPVEEAVGVVPQEMPMAPSAMPEKLSEPIYNGGVGLGKKCGPPTYQSCSSYLECRDKICQYPIKVIPIQNSEQIAEAERPTKIPVKEEAVEENLAEEPVKDVMPATGEKVEETTTVMEDKPLLPGYERHSTGNYKFNKRMVTWSRAKAICEAEGSHLAVVNSDEESKVLIKMFERYPENYWQPKYKKIVFASVGFSDLEKEGVYKTIFGEPLSSTGFERFWRKNEPNNLGASKTRPGEDCGAIHRNGGLNDFFCSIHLPFICEQ